MKTAVLSLLICAVGSASASEIESLKRTPDFFSTGASNATFSVLREQGREMKPIPGAAVMATSNIDCKGNSIMMDGKELSISMRDLEDGGKLISIVGEEGSRSDRVVKESSMSLEKLPEFLDCDVKKEDCLSKVFGEESKDVYRMSIVSNLGILEFYRREGLPVSVSFDIRKAATGRMFHIDKPSKFGGVGLSEYFDASGSRLGRLFTMIEVFECR